MTATLPPQAQITPAPRDPQYGAAPQPYPSPTPVWLKACLAVLAIAGAAAIGAATATAITLKANTAGTAVTAPPPSASVVHDANVKLCTLYYSAGEAMANWDKQHPTTEQQDGTTGASVYLVTGNFLMWALDQTADADKDLRENVRAVAQASIDSAGVYSGKPAGLVQPPTFVPNSAFGEPGQKIYDFCVKGG